MSAIQLALLFSLMVAVCAAVTHLRRAQLLRQDKHVELLSALEEKVSLRSKELAKAHSQSPAEDSLELRACLRDIQFIRSLRGPLSGWGYSLKIAFLIAVPAFTLLSLVLHLPTSVEQFLVEAEGGQIKIVQRAPLHLYAEFSAIRVEGAEVKRDCEQIAVQEEFAGTVTVGHENPNLGTSFRMQPLNLPPGVEIAIRNNGAVLEVTLSDLPVPKLDSQKTQGPGNEDSVIAYVVQQVRPATGPGCSSSVTIRSRPGETVHRMQLYLSTTRTALLASPFQISEMGFDTKTNESEVNSMIQGGTFHRSSMGGRSLELRPRESLVTKLSSGSLFSVDVIPDGLRFEGVGTFTSLQTGFKGMMEDSVPTWFDYFRYHLKEGWVAIAVIYSILGMWGLTKKPESPVSSDDL